MKEQILCPWCGSDEITSRTVKDFKNDGETKVDLCRCADCGRTFSVTKEMS